MNSEQASALHATDMQFARQAIVDRHHGLWACEYSVLGGVNGEPLENASLEILQRMNPRRQTSGVKVNHKFLRIGQSALMNDGLVKAIIQTAHALEQHRQPLTLSLDNPLDALPGPLERRAMVRQLYKLKDHSDITLAYNNYTLDTKLTDLLADLKLYDYIKMPFPDSALRLSLNMRSSLFDRLYDRMLELISNTQVHFIADHIEFADSALLAKNLPFEYFQGGYYSPADCL
ncbi:YuxH family protein [Pseudomonas sp. S1_E04]